MASATQRLKRHVLSRLAAQFEATKQSDFDTEFVELLGLVKPFTMTSPERLYGLHEAVTYVLRERIPGDVVECGVWRGGSSMLIAKLLLTHGDTDRRLWMYDTYQGMPEPTAEDGTYAVNHYPEAGRDEDFMAYATLDDVQANLKRTGIAESRIEYVVGLVEDSIPARVPDAVALLRLDTDWYQSTLHELNHLYDRLAPGGVLIIDDYGHWHGARRAVDEFFEIRGFRPLFARLDYTGRMIIKPSATS
jgi:SAM-dependent methyltransferase